MLWPCTRAPGHLEPACRVHGIRSAPPLTSPPAHYACAQVEAAAESERATRQAAAEAAAWKAAAAHVVGVATAPAHCSQGAPLALKLVGVGVRGWRP